MDLHSACPKESYLHLPEKMDHNEFQLDEDLIEPFKDFLSKLNEDSDEPPEQHLDDDPVVNKPKSKSITNLKNFKKKKPKQGAKEEKKSEENQIPAVNENLIKPATLKNTSRGLQNSQIIS